MSNKSELAKSIKRPDILQGYMVRVLDWLLKNQKYVYYVAVPVVLGVVGYYVYGELSLSKQTARVDELAKIELAYEEEEQKAVKERDAVKKEIDALAADTAKKDDKAPQAAKPAAEPAKDPAVEAKRAELEKKMEAVKADHSATFTQYKAFYEQNKSTPEGWMAGMKAVAILTDTKKFSEAKPLLEDVLKQSAKAPFYQVQGRFVYASILEELGELDQALRETDTLLAQVTDDMKPQVLLAKGRVQLLKNARDEAKATFDAIIEKHAATPEAQKARGMKALLN